MRAILVVALAFVGGCFDLDRLETLYSASFDSGDGLVDLGSTQEGPDAAPRDLPGLDQSSTVDANEMGTDLKLSPSDLQGAADDLLVGDQASSGADLGPRTERLVFITSALVRQDELSSLVDADDRCQAAATAASLSGTYKAWMSAPGLPAKERFTHATGRYRLLTGETVAANWSDLVDGTIAHAIDVNELGQVQPSAVGTDPNRYRSVLTATAKDGSFSGINDWRSGGELPLGSASQVDEDWTHIIEGYVAATGWSYGLYCFEQ